MKPISNTAFFCCGVRMDDAASKKPIVGDHYAKLFMDTRGLDIYSRFKGDEKAKFATTMRPKLIDDYIKRQLDTNPELPVFTIGAGFDTRPYRFNSGVWYEVDEPQVIEYKNEKLPIEQSKNSLTRIPIDFESESLEDKLSPYKTDRPVLIVYEGVILFLDEATVQDNLQILKKLFPNHQIICDMMTKQFLQQQNPKKLQDSLNGINAPFAIKDAKPEDIFLQNNYKLDFKQSIILESRKHRWKLVPDSVIRLILKPALINGYQIYAFRSSAA